MYLLSKIIFTISILTVKNAEPYSWYDTEMLKSLGFSFKTLQQMNLVGCTNRNERCAQKDEEMNGPINEMGANAGFDSPNSIFRDTNKLMMDLVKEGSMLAKDSDDNDDESKYVFSLIQYFHLRFLKIYNKLVVTEDPNKVYDVSFDKALVKTNDHRIWDALQLAVPVRRGQYVLASVIDTLIEIVQKACSKHLLDWQCGARYFIMLAKETNRCPDLWYNHHKVFAETLKLVQNNRKTLTDVTNDVVATVDYMTSRRSFDYDYEYPYFNRRDINYDDYEILPNYYVSNDILDESKNEYSKASNPYRYAKSFQEYYDIIDARRSKSDNNAGLVEYVDLMPYYDFRTEAGSKLNNKDFDYLENEGNYRKSDDTVLNEPVKIISSDDDNTEEENNLQKEMKLKNVSDVVFFANSILMDRNTFDDKKPVKAVTKKHVIRNRFSQVDINEYLNGKVMLNLLQDNDIDDGVLYDDEDYISFYEDIKRRNILFDTSLKILHLYRHVLKDFLIRKAELLNLVDTYQKQDKLKCIFIEHTPVI